MDATSDVEEDNRIKLFCEINIGTAKLDESQDHDRTKKINETTKMIKEEEKDMTFRSKKNNTFESKMKDYELRIDPSVKMKNELNSYAMQKKLLSAKQRIKDFKNEMRNKRAVINKNLKEKNINEIKNINNIYNEIMNDIEKKQDDKFMKKIAMLKIKKKGLSSKTKDIVRKKNQKQTKKKSKIKANYFKIYNYDKMCEHISVKMNYSDLGAIDDWMTLLDTQLRTILDRKKYPVEMILSTLTYQISKDLVDDIETATPTPMQKESLKIKLKRFDGNEYNENLEASFRKAVAEEKVNDLNYSEINRDREKEKEKERKDKLMKLLDEIETMKNKNEDVNKKKEHFDDLLEKLHDEEKNIKKKEENRRLQYEEEIAESPNQEYQTKKTVLERSDNDEKDKREKLKIKQRLVKFSFKIFDKFDITKVIEYWMSRLKHLENEKKAILDKRVKKEFDEDEKKQNKEKEDKKKEKTDANIKYEFKKPEKDIRKIIPYCNNLFYIIKNEN